MYTCISVLVIVGASRGAEVEAAESVGSNSSRARKQEIRIIFIFLRIDNSNMRNTLVFGTVTILEPIQRLVLLADTFPAPSPSCLPFCTKV